MIQKIPALNIPKTTKNDSFKIFSKYFIIFISNYFKNFKEKEIDIELEIAKQNNHKDIYKYNHYYDIFNLLQDDLYNIINKDSFWTDLMADNTCKYFHKKGANKNNFCQREIHIETLHKYGKYLCCRHIPKKYHEIKKNIIDEKDRCIGITKYNENCNIRKKYGKYCIHHVPKIKNTIEEIDDEDLVKEDIEEKKEIKLICYYNDKSLEIKKVEEKNNLTKINIKNNKLVQMDQNNFKNNENNSSSKIEKDKINNIQLRNKKIDINQLNIDIDNFKYKLELIDEIINIKPTCNIRNCKKINKILISKCLFCNDCVISSTTKSTYKFNDWNYL
jgi:hypothetical protein